jgi:Fe-S cluster assembly protein SufD
MDLYLAHFEQMEKDFATNNPPAVNRLRQTAMARFVERGFPGPRNEDWRFTSVAPIVQTTFQPAAADYERINRISERVRAGTFTLPEGTRLVFVDGIFARDLSHLPLLGGGVVCGSLASALHDDPAAVEADLARSARFDDHPFVALNTALFKDGAYVRVPPESVVEGPLFLVFIATTAGEPLVFHPRNLIVLEASSQVTLVESYVALEEGVSFTNAVTEIVLADNAVVDHYKVQRESTRAFHVAVTQVHQGRASRFTSHYVGLGGGLVRNEVRAVLAAERCECTLNGLYRAGGRQHADNFTVIDHAQPHCTSHELYKGILDGHGHGVFNGKIFVRPGAQKTDAKQTNQTLLLSEDAVINTKPQLEIFADDVKCTHGATVGQLSEDALFYLRSRGLGKEQARGLLTFAFANDIVSRIKVEPIRAELEALLTAGQPILKD